MSGRAASSSRSLMTRIWLGVGSLLLILVLVEIGLRLAGYFYLHRLRLSGEQEIGMGASHTILAVGDSYTVGGNGKWENNYPSQLQKILSDNYPQKYAVINGGVCEANSTQIYYQLMRLIKAYKVDSVVLLVGSANRFNPAGYSRHWQGDLLSQLRLFKVFKILMINLQGKKVQEQLRAYQEARIKGNTDYAYNQAGDFRDRVELDCDEEMAAQYRAEIKANPEQVETYYRLAECYKEQNRFLEEEALYREMITRNRGSEAVYRNLGENYQKQSKYHKAEALFQKMIDRYPDRVWPYISLANHYVVQGEYREADVLFSQALKLDSDREFVYSAMADYYGRVGKYDQAEAMYRRSLELKSDENTFIELAWINLKLGKFDEAMKIILQAIKLYPTEFANQYFLLRIYEMQSVYDAAALLRFFSDIQAENPALRDSEEFQGYVYFLKNRQKIEDKIDDWLRDDLNKIVQLCRANNIRLIIQNYPFPYHAANRVLKEVAFKESVPFVDNYSVFENIPEEERETYFSDFDHNTKEGHRIIAENVYRLLVKERYGVDSK